VKLIKGMVKDLIELKGKSKRLGYETTFLELETSNRFVEKVKNDFGLKVEYDEKYLRIIYNENHCQQEKIEDVKNDNLVLFLLSTIQDGKPFYMVCPYWYIIDNYHLN